MEENNEIANKGKWSISLIDPHIDPNDIVMPMVPCSPYITQTTVTVPLIRSEDDYEQAKAEICLLERSGDRPDYMVALSALVKVYADEHHPNERPYYSNLNILAPVIHNVMREKGFWEGENNFSEKCMLVVTELSEAVEAVRHGNPASEHIPEYMAIEEEFADVIIRILDVAGSMEFDIAGALNAKMLFNETRPYKHGKAF